MKFHDALRLTTYALMLTAAAAVSVSEEKWLYVGASLCVCAMNWGVQRTESPFYLAKWLSSFLSVVAFVFAFVDMEFLSQNSILAFAHFLLVVLGLKLFEQKSVRDYFLIYLLAMVLMSVAAMQTIEIGFGYSFLAFALLGTCGLILITLQDAAEQAQPPRDTQGADSALLDRVLVPRRFLGFAAALTLVCLIIAVPLFMVLPRSPVRLLGRTIIVDPEPIMGFSEEVQLGEIGTIKENDELVMKVKPKGESAATQAEASFLWRGIALDFYDGRSWRAYKPMQVMDQYQRRWKIRHTRTADEFVLEEWYKVKPAEGEEIEQQIELRPLNCDTLFAVYAPVYIKGLVTTTSTNVLEFDWVGEHLAVQMVRTQKKTYTVKSRVPKPSEAKLKAAAARFPDAQMATFYLQLPQMPDRIAELARQVAPNAAYPSAYEKAQAIERYLRDPSNFRYTLERTATPEVEPVEDFLFNRKAGHCEYFASAMVILLRSLAIPSRLVNGFKEGEWNAAEEAFLVRQRDAHSWVEVYLDGVGWVTFDPTPAADSPRSRDRRHFLAYLTRLSDIMSLRWSTYIVSYEVHWQKPFIERLWYQAHLRPQSLLAQLYRRYMLEPEYRVADASAEVPAWKKIAWVSTLVILATVAGFFITRKAGWRLFVRGQRPARTRTSVKFYRDLLKALKKKGYVRWPHETPQEFADSVLARGGERLRPVRTITERFCEARYGGREIGRQEVAQIEAMLKEIAHER
ncbi:MAG: DUF3488 domain-containing protein [Planctomycetes bacterium]|nr:DUF3488 domain-containing protein [Planctomycetota bacterium]